MKVTVSLDEALVGALSAAGRMARKPRSRIVEEALVAWRRSQLEQALKEGYLAMAQEDRAIAESHMPAGWRAFRRSHGRPTNFGESPIQ